jgi:hypothetical protein
MRPNLAADGRLNAPANAWFHLTNKLSCTLFCMLLPKTERSKVLRQQTTKINEENGEFVRSGQGEMRMGEPGRNAAFGDHRK